MVTKILLYYRDHIVYEIRRIETLSQSQSHKYAKVEK